MKPYAVGIDVGGTKMAAGLVSHDGRILARSTIRSHAERAPEVVIEAIGRSFRRVVESSKMDSADIEGVGLGFPGNTNGPAGRVLVSSNLPEWHNYPLRDVVAERLGLPVILDNDTNLCAIGEHRYGAGRGTRNMCYVTISTGLGLGIIIDNQLYVGNTGTAGELAHVVIDVGGPKCTCGKRGCLMVYASGIGMSRMAYEHIEAGADTILKEGMPPDGSRFEGEWIAEAARQGDAVAGRIIQKAAYYAGVGLAIIIQVINPELIVVGGGLTKMGSLLQEPMLLAMREHTQREVWDSARVVPWTLGSDLGILGGAAKVFAHASSIES